MLLFQIYNITKLKENSDYELQGVFQDNTTVLGKFSTLKKRIINCIIKWPI